MNPEFHFIRPLWLLALIPYAILIVLSLKHKLKQGNWSVICDAELLPFLLETQPVLAKRWQLTLGAIAALFTIFALAGPTWQRLPAPVFRNDSALVIALDLSLSMNATDIKPSRLIRARYKIADILTHRKEGQSALLVYAGDAFTVTPLTDDKQTIISQLEALNTNIMPNQGNNTIQALAKATDLLKQAALQKGTILLVTDGVDLNATLPAIKALADYRLSVLAVGTEDGAPIAAGAGGFVKDDNGEIVIPRLNVKELKQVALEGHGDFQLLSSNDQDVQNILASIDTSSSRQGQEKKDLLLEQWDDKGPWLLLLVLPLAALLFRRGLIIFLGLIVLPWPQPSQALTWDDLWQTKNQQAYQAFKKGDYPVAAEKFENPDWKAAAQYKAGQFKEALENLQTPNSADSYYNQGNALAKAGQLPEAIKAYEQALALKPNDEDAKYNKELVEKALEKQQQEANKEQNKDNKQANKKDQESQDSKDKGQQQQAQNGEKTDSADQQGQSGESDQQPKASEQQPSQDQNNQQHQQTQTEPSQAQQKPTADQAAEQAQETQGEQSKAKPTLTEQESHDENQQANQQWLNRIPDNPAGLLKRKFLYQYSQQERQKSGKPKQW
ncbi:MAG: VWA domain-containing protein [Methylococcaceae bacterium]|jgi:Ca-activated chloride channel family protein